MDVRIQYARNERAIFHHYMLRSTVQVFDRAGSPARNDKMISDCSSKRGLFNMFNSFLELNARDLHFESPADTVFFRMLYAY